MTDTRELTFDQLPKAVGRLMEDVQELKQLLIDQSNKPVPAVLSAKFEEDEVLTIEEAEKITRLKPAALYRNVRLRLMPGFKRGKRIYFNKSELYAWLREGKKNTLKEMSLEADRYINNKKGLQNG